MYQIIMFFHIHNAMFYIRMLEHMFRTFKTTSIAGVKTSEGGSTHDVFSITNKHVFMTL